MPPRRNEPCPCGSGKRFKHCHGRGFGPPPVPREIADSVRFVCFETHLEDFRYATNGGTAFIVRRKGTPFGITCRHVLRGFSIDDLVITDARTGRKAAGIKGMYHPTNLRGENEGSDLDDICVIAFNEFEGQFFDGAYDLDRQPAASSEPANQGPAVG
jgi:SEC-C motif